MVEGTKELPCAYVAVGAFLSTARPLGTWSLLLRYCVVRVSYDDGASLTQASQCTSLLLGRVWPLRHNELKFRAHWFVFL